MKNDETLEREVRASLRASATHPIPDDLVARIGAIPAGQPPSQGTVSRLPRYARFAAELAAAAVVVVAVSALILVAERREHPGRAAWARGNQPGDPGGLDGARGGRDPVSLTLGNPGRDRVRRQPSWVSSPRP